MIVLHKIGMVIPDDNDEEGAHSWFS